MSSGTGRGTPQPTLHVASTVDTCFYLFLKLLFDNARLRRISHLAKHANFTSEAKVSFYCHLSPLPGWPLLGLPVSPARTPSV